jgi:RNA polymerase sigma-70 factor (ECF subfamily)
MATAQAALVLSTNAANRAARGARAARANGAIAAELATPAIKRHESGIFPVVRTPETATTPATIAAVTTKAAANAGVRARVRVDETSDEGTLVEAMIRNDPHAWKEFQRRYDRLILRCITKVTKRFAAISQDDIREIYATLLVSLLSNDKNKLRTFDPERGNRFSSWIGLLAIHCAYDYLRGMRREPQKEALAEACELAAELPDPYEQTAKRERADIAARVLAGFSKRDRTFAALYFGEGMAPDEIAHRMNISVKTVYSKKHKIQSRLEAMLGAATCAGRGPVFAA